MSIFIWNVQGAGGNSFQPILKNYLRIHRPFLVVLLEPRISGHRALSVIRRLGFSHSFRVEAIRFSGGIWMLWNSDIEVRILLTHRQFIHANIVWQQRSFNFTAIYASPQYSLQPILWTHLRQLAQNSTQPWLLGGDFNAKLDHHDKREGSSTTSMINKPFQLCVQDYSLHDLSFNDP